MIKCFEIDNHLPGVHDKVNKQAYRIKFGNYIGLAIATVLFNTIMLFTNSCIVGVILIGGLTILCIFYSRMNVFHPLTWFTSIYLLYNTSYALLVLIYGYSTYGLTSESLKYSLQGLSAVVLICAAPRYEKYYSRDNFQMKSTDMISKRDYLIVKKCLIYGMLIAFGMTLIVSRSFISKSMSTKGGLFSICTYLIRALTFLCGIYILGANKTNRIRKSIVIICGILCTVFAFLNAERDCLLRYILVVFITLFLKKIIKKKHLFIFAPLGMLFMVIQNRLKYYFINGSIRIYSGDLFSSFLSSDFSAPGGNLQNAINYHLEGIAGYKTILTDVIQGVLPFFRLGVNYTSWYNNTFFSGSSYSRAFSLVGEGYLIDGSCGVLALFIIIGFFIVVLTKKIQKNIWFTMMYVYGIITIISCFRLVLLDVVTGLVRVPLIAFFIFCVAQAVFFGGKVRL